jgi:hypothetical protein
LQESRGRLTLDGRGANGKARAAISVLIDTFDLQFPLCPGLN